MVNYQPKEWLSFIFKFHKADTFRKLLPTIIIISAYAGLVAFCEAEWGHYSEKNALKNIPAVHSLLGFVISMLLVFRTNTAYDRWWEGRKLWGSLVNNSRNLALKLSAILHFDNKQHRSFFKRFIPMYASALNDHLKAEKTRVELFEDDEHHHIISQIDTSKHVPNQVAKILYGKMYQLEREGLITTNQMLLLNSELQSFTDICGACERIKNTPIPFSYSVFIKKFIFIYVITLPIGFVFSFGYFVVPVTAFVFYVLASIEMIAEEIEDPFSGDENDIPTEKIMKNIAKHIGEIL